MFKSDNARLDWNHGSIQLAVFQKKGLITFPTTFSDPGFQGCFAPYLMSYHGGLSMKGLAINEILELIRGTFIIHTRAYNAKKPMDPDSNFYRLYSLFRKGALQNVSEPAPAMKLGKRTEEEEKEFTLIWVILVW